MGSEISESTVAILYLCKLKDNSLELLSEVQFTDIGLALDYYANIPNPESQLITGEDKEDLYKHLQRFYERKDTENFINYLKETI
ncbi:MAG: hypothetical protein GY827_04700 [Cytophagales bacterium]|nr:hypothetical protein [Cytophagales bacterium]